MKTFKELLLERRGINLVVVDIQPTYEKSVLHFLDDFIQFLNENDFAKVLYLFNGPELGFEDERELSFWLMENGLDEEKIEEFEFFDKGYAFFRGWMDTGVDEDDIIEVGRYMYKNDIRDSRDVAEEVYEKMGLEELIDKDDSIYIPDVIDELKKLSRPLLCGGGKYECIREVELLMKIIKKPYKLHKKFIY